MRGSSAAWAVTTRGRSAIKAARRHMNELNRIVSLACLLCAASACYAGQSAAEALIESGHWKRARALVEVRIREAPDDPLANYLLSQIRNAFGDRTSPLPLAEKAL